MNDDDDNMITQLEHVINTIKCANHALAEIPGMHQYRYRLIDIIGDLAQEYAELARIEGSGYADEL